MVTNPSAFSEYDRYAVISISAALLGALCFLLIPLRVSIVLVPALYLAGIVCGVLAVRRIGMNGAKGRGLATAGYLCGGLGLVAFIFLLVAGAIVGGSST
ncbi:MAG: hypothetical protein LBB54_02005 [Cellulomonadaceae bacterium]|nr:hypothetical protein [Cellulomonadaceae bacterium]